MPAHRSTRPNTAILVATVLASLALHVVLWPIGNRIVSFAADGDAFVAPGGVMQVTLLPPELEPVPEEEKPKPPEPEDLQDPPGRVINQDALVNEQRPDEAKYVSEFDQTVERETRTPKRRPEKGAPATPSPRTQPASEPRGGEESQEQQDASNPAEAVEGEDVPLHDRGEVAQAERPEQQGEAAQRPGSSKLPNLRRLPPQTRERLGGGPGSIDVVDDDAELGSAQLLNSKRWKYASFFNRVRNQVAQHWHPEVVHATRDPHGRVYGTKTRRTLLVISLNPDGSIARVRLDPGNESGAPHLDEEAIRAVRAAAPFTNPPPQLVSAETGLIEFGFGFIFEIGGKTKIFRYQR